MKLRDGTAFESLYMREGLIALDGRFVAVLAAQDIALHNRLMEARAAPSALDAKALSQLLIDLAPHVEDFIAALFSVEKELRALQERHHALAPLYTCKRLFVQRRALKAWREEEVSGWDGDALAREVARHLGEAWDALAFAKATLAWLEAPEAHTAALEAASRYAAWASVSPAGRARHKGDILFTHPHKLDSKRLIPVETVVRDGVTMLRLSEEKRRIRHGFALTDDGGSLAKALDHGHYCIYCHNQDKDSCSKGFREKDGRWRVNPLGVMLAGCPLEEKISEMNWLKSNGVPVGALAVVCVDNPMCAGTGHRICNDCMKSCIYQKQEPVDIPRVETRVLRDVLGLPYGFEIYSLLTRWNPLDLERPLPRPATGYRVLVAGLGPAGYTLSHHLMNDGHSVVAVDGLKIEPLTAHVSGVTPEGERVAFEPVRDIAALTEDLDRRVMAGFGGVAEYGITVRWDKNFLTVIRLLLERREQFAMFGGVRFGSALTYDNAFALGFDHIALCLGAGRPTLLDIPNGLARGVRTASDFLMGLQLTGAAKKDSIANLQLRLPVVVIGGGLTAIDTATEALAYYPVQVEKFLSRYEVLAREYGEAHVRAAWTEEEAEIAEEFLSHARLLRAERETAEREGRTPDFWPLLDAWGGVKIVYRKRLIDAPSYRLNHEEVEKALEEGVLFGERWEPEAVEVDRFGHACALRLRRAGDVENWREGDVEKKRSSHLPTSSHLILPARTILIAAGTNPNTVLAREDAAHFTLDGRYFRTVDESGQPVLPERTPKPATPRVLMSLEADGRAVSFFGDLHPSYAGNVVKAMGSAKQGYPVISRVLHRYRPSPPPSLLKGEGSASPARAGLRRAEAASAAQAGEGALTHSLHYQLRATVRDVRRLTPAIVEVIIHAPLAAARFQPGQFYRLQNYERYALRGVSQEETPTTRHSSLATTFVMEGLALTGAWVDKKAGLVSVIVLEMGGSSDLCAYLQPGEPMVLMGPTGSPTEIPSGETVLLAGGGLGNAVLFSIGAALKTHGSRVLYFAGYRKAEDRYKMHEIERAADVVVWCCDERRLDAGRPQDLSFHGTIVEAMHAYASGALGDVPMTMESVQRIIAIGSDRMMAAVAQARHTLLAPWLPAQCRGIGSINSPMQCMMKEICAQCLQQHRNPVTGEVSYVYSCTNQDQDLDKVVFPHLTERLAQNAAQEKLTSLWIRYNINELISHASKA